MLRLLDDFLWVLRREGFVVSTARAIDAARACELIGFEDRAAFRDALAAVLVERAADRARFQAVFDRFFTASSSAERASARAAPRSEPSASTSAPRSLRAAPAMAETPARSWTFWL